MTIEKLKIGNIAIDVTFKPIKNLHLSVHPPTGNVTIASPDFYDLEKVKIYAATRLGWIKKEQKKFLNQARESKRAFLSQESHFFLGKRYLLSVRSEDKNQVKKKANKIHLSVTDEQDWDLKRKVLYDFYRKELRQRLDHYIKQYTISMSLPMPVYSVRAMKTKWGSCASNSNRLWFNIELAKKPLDCIEYIVVHELVHLIERNHNKNFIRLMDVYLPNWRVQKKVLNELPLG